MEWMFVDMRRIQGVLQELMETLGCVQSRSQYQKLPINKFVVCIYCIWNPCLEIWGTDPCGSCSVGESHLSCCCRRQWPTSLICTTEVWEGILLGVMTFLNLLNCLEQHKLRMFNAIAIENIQWFRVQCLLKNGARLVNGVQVMASWRNTFLVRRAFKNPKVYWDTDSWMTTLVFWLFNVQWCT